MTRQNIGIGSAANDGNGDTLRTAGTKINANFREIYTFLADSNNLSTQISLENDAVVFEGSTANDFEIRLKAKDATADRDIILPNVSGNLVLDSATQTLTNKTLTSPVLTASVIGGTTTTASGNLIVDPATQIVEVRGDANGVEGQIQLNCHQNTHGQKITAADHSVNATNTLTLPGGSTIGNADATLVSDTGTQTLTNKTLTSPTITGTGAIAGTFTGNITGNVIGNVTGDVTGNIDGIVGGTTPAAVTGTTITSTTTFQLKAYADTTARDSAIASPVAGMLVYLTATNKAQVYNGSGWVDLH